MKQQKLKESQGATPVEVSPPLRPKRAAQTAAQGFAPADSPTTTTNQNEKGHF
jgi:hypothetical protein